MVQRGKDSRSMSIIVHDVVLRYTGHAVCAVYDNTVRGEGDGEKVEGGGGGEAPALDAEGRGEVNATSRIGNIRREPRRQGLNRVKVVGRLPRGG